MYCHPVTYCHSVTYCHPVTCLRLVFLGILVIFVIDTGLLILLVLGNQIHHVTLCLSELHLVHTLASVPVEEGLSSEHSTKLVANPGKQLLDGSVVSDEGGGHAKTLGRDVTDGRLHIVGDPLHKVGKVLDLH